MRMITLVHCLPQCATLQVPLNYGSLEETDVLGRHSAGIHLFRWLHGSDDTVYIDALPHHIVDNRRVLRKGPFS